MRKRLLLLSLTVLVLLAVMPAMAQDEGGIVFVRVAHLSPDTPAVDIFVNGTPSDIKDLEFKSVTGWIQLPAGNYTFSAVPQGGIRSGVFDLPAGAWITVAAIGSLENNTLKLVAITEDYSLIAEGRTRVTVFHAIEDAPPVDVLSGEFVVAPRLAYPGTIRDNDGAYSFNPRAGTYDIKVVPNGASSPIVIDLPDTELEAGMHYFVAAVGTLAEPDVVLAATDPDA